MEMNWKTTRRAVGLSCVFALLVIQRAPLAATATTTAEKVRLVESVSRQPLGFEENLGQLVPAVRFRARASAYDAFLTDDGATFSFRRADNAGAAVMRMELAGSQKATRIVPGRLLPGRANYFKGDTRNWRTGIGRYAEVRYEAVYPGIDVVFHGEQRALEYDFVVAPGADVRVIGLRFTGAASARVDAAGDLLLDVNGLEVRHRKPVIYQHVEGVRRSVSAAYRVAVDGRVGFEVGEYDTRHALVIDPVVVYSSYLGGPAFPSPFGGDRAWDIAVDAEGCAYITGQADSPAFPTTAGAFQTESPGDSDVFIAKVSADGSTLLYSTLLGGPYGENFDSAGIAVDAAGHAYVTGNTGSGADFPTTPGAYHRAGGSLFIAKIHPSGASLVYSTLIPAQARGEAIAVDALGQAYVTGGFSGVFPTKNPFMPTLAAAGAFVLKLNAAGSDLVFSSFLGGSTPGGDFDTDVATAIALDAAGDIYVGGRTSSDDFPRVNAAQAARGGGSIDAFVTKIHASGSFIIYSTFIGGNDRETVLGLAVDASGSAYAAGFTSSANFPAVNALQSYGGGADDAFVTRLTPAGSGIAFSTPLGGSSMDLGFDVALDSRGNVYIAGRTDSSDFPLTRSLGPSFGTGVEGDAFVTKLSAGGASVLYSTYFGGDRLEFANAIAVDAAGSAYITGDALYGLVSGLPIVGGFQPNPGGAPPPFFGNIDGFVGKIADDSGRCPDEITSRFRIFKLGQQGPWFSPLRFEWILVQNISSEPIQGPLVLAIDDLQNGVLLGSTRSTSCLRPTGTPLLMVPVDRDGVLSPDEAVLTGVLLYRTRLAPMSYRTRILAAVPAQ